MGLRRQDSLRGADAVLRQRVDGLDSAMMESFWSRCRSSSQPKEVEVAGRSGKRDLRVHRDPLQPPTTPLQHRLPHPDRVRATLRNHHPSPPETPDVDVPSCGAPRLPPISAAVPGRSSACYRWVSCDTNTTQLANLRRSRPPAEPSRLLRRVPRRSRHVLGPATERTLPTPRAASPCSKDRRGDQGLRELNDDGAHFDK